MIQLIEYRLGSYLTCIYGMILLPDIYIGLQEPIVCLYHMYSNSLIISMCTGQVGLWVRSWIGNLQVCGSIPGDVDYTL